MNTIKTGFSLYAHLLIAFIENDVHISNGRWVFFKWFKVLFDVLILCVHVLVSLMLIVISMRVSSMVFHLLWPLMLLHFLHFRNYPIIHCCWIGNHLPSKQNKMKLAPFPYKKLANFSFESS